MKETAVHFVIVLIIVEGLSLSILNGPVFHLERTIYFDGSELVDTLSREWHERRTVGPSFMALLPPTILLIFFLLVYHQHHINYLRHPYFFERDIIDKVDSVFHAFLSTVKKALNLLITTWEFRQQSLGPVQFAHCRGPFVFSTIAVL
jgi:hypothetical protein